jgi:hypothetical protein
MPRDSGGAYTLPAGNPVAADTLIDAAWANSTLADLGNEMSNTLHKDGRVSMTGPLVLSTRGSPLDTDAASWANVVSRIREFFSNLDGRAWRKQTKSANYTAVAADNMSWLNFTSSATLSLPAAATAGNGYLLVIRAGSGVTITVDPDGTETVDGVSTISVGALDWCLLFCDGAAWVSLLTQHPDQTSLTAPDLTRPLLRSPRERVSTTASVTGAVNISLQNDNVLVWTLTGNVTLTLSSPPPSNDALAVTFILIQDGTGSRTVTWPGSVKWPGGVAPVLTTAAGKIDVVTLITYDGGTSYLGFVGGQNF